MKTQTMLKKLKLSDAEFDAIAKAVAKAESKTTGEIKIVLAPESAHYAFWELLAAVCAATVVFAALLPFAGTIADAYNLFAWTERTWMLPALYGFVCFVIIAAAFTLFNIPALDRIVVPKSVRIASVTRRAFRLFVECGVCNTAERSGILLFISYLERQVRIVADSGISKKISHDLWRIISDELAAEIKAGNAANAFIGAIEKCGALLAEHFPAREKNPNELADGLIVLEDAEWY